MSTPTNPTTFLINQRVHSLGNSTKIGTVKYVGNVEGYSGTWVGVDWDDNESGKHDGVQNGVRYFQAKGEKSGSFVRLHSLSSGISLLQALEVRYKGSSTKEEEDEMYVLSANNKRVSIQLLGKDKAQDKMSRFEQLTNAALSFLGVSSSGPSDGIRATIPKLKELDLTGNLLSDWKDISIICQELPELAAINLSNNLMSHDISGMVELNNIRILVLNHTCITWKQVEVLKDYLPDIEELHLMGNNLTEITPTSSSTVQGFDSLRFLNLEDNNISSWDEIVKLSQLKCLTKLFLNKNSLDSIWYPHDKALPEPGNSQDLLEKRCVPFENLSCLLLGGNEIEDLSSTEALNSFPNLIETRLSENPLSDPGGGGVPRYVLIACLAKVKILNSSEISARERKDSEIRYVRLAMSKVHDHPEENKWLHPSATKDDDDADDIEGEEEVELVVPKLDEKDQKSYEAVQKLIGEGKLDKLKLDQCKIYLKKHGLRMAGNKDTLIQRIKEHISILDGGGERKYPASSFVLNCKGDACMGDIVMFEQNVYEMFNIASRSASGPPCGKRTVSGRIIKESYGAAKQQHTFTIEVLWSKGEKPFPPLHPLLIKGRNLYRIMTMRQKWEDEGERRRILSDKHVRGAVARSNRDARAMLKSKRAPNGKSKHENNKRGPTLQHPAPQEQHEFKNQQKQNNFHVNDKTGPIMQHSLHVQLQQQRCHENKNLQNNHFHGNYKRGPNNAYQPKENRFYGNRYFPANGQRMNHHHHQTRHPFTNVNMEYSRMIPYGGRMHPSNYMGESSRIPYTQYGPMHPLAATDTGSSMAPAESVTGRGGTYNTGRR